MTAWLAVKSGQTYLWGADTVRSKKSDPPQAPLPQRDTSTVDATERNKTRVERLAKLKRALDDGSYQISAEDVAQKVIDRLKSRPLRE